MSHNSSPSPGGRPLSPHLSIVQHNSHGSWVVFLSLFNSFASAKCLSNTVCLQDPPFWHSRLSSFQKYTTFAPPGGSGSKPKVAFYVSVYLLAQATVLTGLFNTPDVAALDMFGVQVFRQSLSHVQIQNLYNLWTKSTSKMMVSPLLAFPESSFPTLVVGDFNIHHSLPYPVRTHSTEELATSFPYFSRSSELGFSLHNHPGGYTHFPLGGSGHPSVLDLSFASPSLLLFCYPSDTALPSTGSDHVPIQIMLSNPFSSPPPPSPNWSLTDWPTLEPLIKDFTVPPPSPLPARVSLEAWFDRHLACLTTLLTFHTPTKRSFYPSQPWWSPLLSLLRKEFHSALRKAHSFHSPFNRAITNLSKKGYLKDTKAAKAANWKSLLASATLRSIWTIKKLYLGKLASHFPSLPDETTYTQIQAALLNLLFPPQPPRSLPSILRLLADCTSLTPEEISTALSKCSPFSAPGPDTIPYSVWKALYRIAPDILHSLLGPLRLFGHNLSRMKMANEVILDKPGKPSYDSPASFCLIVLLQTILKILERIIASRLSAIARYVGLLHRNQCDSLPSLSFFDACTTLTDTVCTLKCPALMLSSLFLAFKGALIMLTPTSFLPLCASKGSTTTSSPGSCPS